MQLNRYKYIDFEQQYITNVLVRLSSIVFLNVTHLLFNLTKVNTKTNGVDLNLLALIKLKFMVNILR